MSVKMKSMIALASILVLALVFTCGALYAGTERYLLDILDRGGAGCITATANMTAGLCQAVFRAWRSGDHAEAERRQESLTDIRLAMQQYPLVPLQKALMHRRTADGLWTRLLPPFTALDDREAVESIAQQLGAIGG